MFYSVIWRDNCIRANGEKKISSDSIWIDAGKVFSINICNQHEACKIHFCDRDERETSGIESKIPCYQIFNRRIYFVATVVVTALPFVCSVICCHLCKRWRVRASIRTTFIGMCRMLCCANAYACTAYTII